MIAPPSITDDDLSPVLDSAFGDELLRGSEVRYFKLALEVADRPRPLLVEVTPPNRLEYDRRVAADAVNEFLLARGFMRLPQNEPAHPGV